MAAAVGERRLRKTDAVTVSFVRNYLTFMSGSDSQQVAHTATLLREAAHEWYISYKRQNRGPPRDWASLVAALLDRFGSKHSISGGAASVDVHLIRAKVCERLCQSV